MVRNAEARDIPRIAEIIIFGKRVAYRDIFQNDAVSFQELQVVSLTGHYNKNHKLLEQMLVYDDGIVKGVINRQRRADAIEICEFYVEPFFLGQGIGTQLLDKTVQEARQQGKFSIYLWVIAENQKAREFYEAHGFSASGKTAVIEGTDKLDMHYEMLVG